MQTTEEEVVLTRERESSGGEKKCEIPRHLENRYIFRRQNTFRKKGKKKIMFLYTLLLYTLVSESLR